VDIHTRRQKQQALMAEAIERKIRMHAQRLYDKRGQAEGFALQDWVQAESEVLSNSILAPLYRKTRSAARNEIGETEQQQFVVNDSCCSEAGA